jgi:tRNA (adenine57-N1/adenine58-N1)-methyltransferase
MLPSPPPQPQPAGPEPPAGRDLSAGEVVLLHDKAGRRYRLVLAPGASYSTHAGTLAHDSLIGQPEGTVVATNLGRRLLALRPTFAEHVVERKRRAQPIYPKDLAAILVHADVSPGDLVVEAGTGTGALAMAALRAVGPAGRVVSYELREDFHAAATASIEEVLGAVPPNVDLRLGDVYEGIPERDVDRVLLDLPEPWRALPGAAQALRPGGMVFAHCPNATQVQRFCDEMREVGGFGLIETVEVLERPWTVRGRSLRPSHRMVAHTGFLTFARRLAGPEVFEAESEGF